MSDSKGKVLCQEANCAAAYPLPEIGNAAWGCSFIDGSGRIMPRLIQNSNIFVNTGRYCLTMKKYLVLPVTVALLTAILAGCISPTQEQAIVNPANTPQVPATTGISTPGAVITPADAHEPIIGAWRYNGSYGIDDRYEFDSHFRLQRKCIFTESTTDTGTIRVLVPQYLQYLRIKFYVLRNPHDFKIRPGKRCYFRYEISGCTLFPLSGRFSSINNGSQFRNF